MKRFLFIFVLVVAGVAVLGFYREWFSFGSSEIDGKSNVTLSVDPDKFQEDRKSAVKSVQNLGKSDGKAEVKDTAVGKTHDGKVVSITAAKLVMTNMEGNQEQTHTLTDDVRITCDGAVCKAADLRPGMRVRVTTQTATPHAATRIEALDDLSEFEKDA